MRVNQAPKNKYYAVVIYPGDAPAQVESFPKDPDLAYLQKAVGGYIEAVPGFKKFNDKPCHAYFNEDGKRLNLEPNFTATALWREQLRTSDIILGNLVIVTKGD